MSDLDLTHVKFLDPTRKGLLKLPASALKIWMCHWMHENCDDESWPSIETVAEETDLAWNTVQTWRSWLLKNGWLEKVREVDTGKPRNLPVVSVKDGSKQNTQNLGTQKSATPKFGYEGSIGLGLGSDSFDLGSRSAASPPVQSVSKEERQPRTSEPTATTRATPTAARGQRAPKGHAPDGREYPLEFDSWTNKQRIEWLSEHGWNSGTCPLGETWAADLSRTLDNYDEL